MNIRPICVGIDISKRWLDVFDEARGALERIDNAPEPIAALIARWRGGDVLVAFEATGVYDAALAAALERAGVAFARVNPARARDFARACGRVAKTDAIDAESLAAFARAIAPSAAPASAPERKSLEIWAKRRDQLVDQRAQEKNRRSEAGDADFVASVGRHIAFLDAEIKALDAKIKAIIAHEDALAQKARIMRTAPGAGPVATTTLLALMPELGAVGPKQIAALAGLAPMNVDSGQFRGKRAIAGGRKRVRDALYMAALAATRAEGAFRTFYLRLRAAGKPAKLALVAVARKLLVTLNAMVRDNVPFHA